MTVGQPAEEERTAVAGQLPWAAPVGLPQRAGLPAVRVVAAPQLPARLSALARLAQIASARISGGGFSAKLLSDAADLLTRAGERLRLSAEHTVVALAGGTGSGKSSLFNRLAGADFSTVGVTRPVTRDAHACVWGIRGSGPLLEWLGVPRRYRYARASALDRGEQSLTGLVLLDLPDHDTVMTHASGLVDRLVGLADQMVWVLDPQKYADAAVHRRFLVPLAGHSEVLAVVLNQADLLTPAQLEDCVGDLRRLLDAENLHEVQILVTSAATGGGLEELRKLLADAVSARRSASARISADVDAIAARFEPYAGDQAAAGISAASKEQLVGAFGRAAGVAAVGEALRSARELRAIDYVGWPVAWLAERLTGRDPVRKVRLGQLWEELRSVTAGPSGAQQAEIDNALTELADEISEPLPAPWTQTTRAAVRSRSQEIPGALGAAMGAALPADNKAVRWWRLVGAWQGLLLGAVIVALAWMAAIVVFGVFHAGGSVPRLFSDVSLLAWIAAMIAALLLLGWLTAAACVNQVRVAAEQETAQFAAAAAAAITTVAHDLVLVPAEQELGELERFRDELRAVTGQPA
jgi:GTP-binding protein EngB required for normal cell division